MFSLKKNMIGDFMYFCKKIRIRVPTLAESLLRNSREELGKGLFSLEKV